MPQTNQVYRLTKRGDPSSLLLLNEPLPSTVRPHEVLVRIKAVSLNYRDIVVMNGAYPLPIKDNVVPCCDMAGDVIKIGEAVIDFKEGDRVTAVLDSEQLYGPASGGGERGLGGPEDGVLQQYRVFPAISLLQIPAHLSYEEAACLMCTHVTAWNALFGGVPLMPGQSVLFQGTGGISIAGLMLAQAAGAMTIIISSSDEKLETAKKLGATHLINYKKNPDWDKKVMEITGGKGVDYIFDSVGVSSTQRCMNCISPGGHIECIGFLGGEPPKDIPNVVMLAFMKNATVRGIRMGPRSQFADLIRFVAARQLRPYVDRVFAFNEIKAALEYMESQKHVGKVVVKVFD